MPKRFEFSAEFGHPVERIHALLTDHEYWRSRLTPDSRGSVEVVESVDRDGRPLVAVTVTEVVDPEGFPALARKVVRGELRMQRIDTWGPVEDGRAAGRVEGVSTGIPVSIEGVYDLRPLGGGALLAVHGTIAAQVPLVGGSIEALARQLVAQMMVRDRDEVSRRLTGSG